MSDSIAADVINDVAADESPRKRAGGQTCGFGPSAYNPSTMAQLDYWMSEVLPTIPITLVPGDFDLTNHGLPQRPVSLALLPRARCYSSVQMMPALDTEPG